MEAPDALQLLLDAPRLCADVAGDDDDDSVRRETTGWALECSIAAAIFGLDKPHDDALDVATGARAQQKQQQQEEEDSDDWNPASGYNNRTNTNTNNNQDDDDDGNGKDWELECAIAAELFGFAAKDDDDSDAQGATRYVVPVRHEEEDTTDLVPSTDVPVGVAVDLHRPSSAAPVPVETMPSPCSPSMDPQPMAKPLASTQARRKVC